MSPNREGSAGDRPLCDLCVFVVSFCGGCGIDHKGTKNTKSAALQLQGVRLIIVAETLFESVERRPLGDLGVLVVHPLIGQATSGSKSVNVIAPAGGRSGEGKGGARTLCIFKPLPLPSPPLARGGGGFAPGAPSGTNRRPLGQNENCCLTKGAIEVAPTIWQPWRSLLSCAPPFGRITSMGPMRAPGVASCLDAQMALHGSPRSGQTLSVCPESR